MAKKVILKDDGIQIFPHTTISAVDGKATDKQIEDATDNVNYTTSKTVKHAIDIHALEAIKSHTENINNPHKVTAEQTGAYYAGNSNKADVDWTCNNLYANSNVIAKQDVIAFSADRNVYITDDSSNGVDILISEIQTLKKEIQQLKSKINNQYDK